jgi:aspartate-semialdehyde dehydrogenase
VTLPVALMGKAGVDELVNQSRGLFNMESPEPEVFPLQIAFNIIPQMDLATQRYSPATLSRAVEKIFPSLRVGYTVAWSPVFYGAMTALHVRLEHPVDLAGLRRAFAHQEGICLMESELPAGNPTPATDSAESADIFIGQIRAEGSDVRLWLVYDPLRLEAGQMVSAVENWIEKPASSMLT